MKKFVLSLLILLSLSFSSTNFEKKEINIYINDAASDKVNVIEVFYFPSNTSYDEKKVFLNESKIIEFLSLKPVGDVKEELVGDNLNILKVKYTAKPFKIFKKIGRFVEEVMNASSFTNLKNGSYLVLNKNTVLKIYVLSKINDKIIIPNDIRKYLSEDSPYLYENIYLVYEFDGPQKIKDFQIIKKYKEPLLYIDQNSIGNPFYILTAMIIFILILIYFKDLIMFVKKVFR